MKTIKSIIFQIVFSVICLSTFSQTRQIHIYHDGSVCHSCNISEIDSIKFVWVLEYPQTVNATLSEKTVIIKWSAVKNATEYAVYRSTDNVNFRLLSTHITATQYTDNAPENGVNYYKIKALKDNIESDLSEATASIVNGIGGGTDTGLYMGIIGFNQSLTHHDISILAPNTKDNFTNFVNQLSTKNGTLLYYAVDDALNALNTTTFPDNLQNVALVTFTDGLDQGSMMMNDAYSSDTEYLSALNQRLKTIQINGLPITAFSIGLKGNDVSDDTQFKNNLINLASTPEYAAEVSNMDEVNAKFQEIAERLVNVNVSQTLSMTIPGQSNGTKIRFTFDNVSNASQSALYIEGIFSLADRSLKDIHYEGMTCGNGNTVSGKQDGIFVTFSFNDIKQTSGETIPTNCIQQWNLINTTQQWQINSEFTPAGNTETSIERKSAVIMLVLDCSSSLGSQFSDVKNHANTFIQKMTANTEDYTGGNTNLNTEEIDVIAELDFDQMVFVEGGSFLSGDQSYYPPSYDWQGIQTSNSLNYDSDSYNTSYTAYNSVRSIGVNSFYIGKYEVTQRLWEYVMNYEGIAYDGTKLVAVGNGPWFGNTPSSDYGKGNNYPAYNISYNDIVNYFLPRLNKITGKTFRLPTAAEWEYAARGGQKDEYTRTHPLKPATIDATGIYYKYAGSNNIDEVAWYYDNSNSTTHIVGQKQPNALGLYDMSGNVAEISASLISTSSTSYVYYIGGYYGSNTRNCRVVSTDTSSLNDRKYYIGFRLALDIP